VVPTAVQLAETEIAIAVGTPLDVLVPHDLQWDVLALQLAVNLGPIGLGSMAMALLGADGTDKLRLQCGVGQFRRQRLVEPAVVSRCSVNRAVDDARFSCRAILLSETPVGLKRSTSRTWHIGVLSAAPPWQKPKGGP
jgi:hypothetical protein